MSIHYIFFFRAERKNVEKLKIISKYSSLTTHLVRACVRVCVTDPVTLVMPMAPILPLYDVVACPAPTSPEMMLQNPSMAMPRFTACDGGGGAPDILAAA